VLMAECKPKNIPKVGCRFSVVVRNTDDVRGIVQVHSIIEETKVALLVCVERTVPEFWEHLETTALQVPGAPAGVILRTYGNSASIPNTRSPTRAEPNCDQRWIERWRQIGRLCPSVASS
jgi:hypothetical protein